MIQFRCWFCNKLYAKPDRQIGQHFTCACEYTLRVPQKTDGNCKVMTIVDWLVQSLVFGGGGALLGFGLAVLIISQLRFLMNPYVSWILLIGFPLVGFLAGLFGGERGIEWIGRMIRDRENR